MNNDPLPRPPTGYVGLGTFVADAIRHLASDGLDVLLDPANLDGPVPSAPVK